MSRAANRPRSVIEYRRTGLEHAALLIVPFVISCGHSVDPCPITDEEYPCHMAHVIGDTNVCATYALQDGGHCRTGVGVCAGGVCKEPDGAPVECSSVGLGAGDMNASDYCTDADGCATNNPCVISECYHPGEESCTYLPSLDGAPCPGGSCFSGACCGPP